MPLNTRIAKWFCWRARDRDLRDEVEFHIDMRANAHANAGLSAEEASALARKQFGNKEAVMNDMRRAHLWTAKTALFGVASAAVIVMGLWIYAAALMRGPVVLPQPPDVPVRVEKRVPPPPPPPPPTWEEFVRKVNTFENGRAGQQRR